jgi:hypothetical protein
MKRRRFAPSAEGLEARELLTTIINPKNPFGTFDPTPVLPDTIEQKSERIDRLPVYMEGLQTDRVIPANVMTNIQNDLRSIVTMLANPSSAVLNAYNLEIRAVLPHASLSSADVKGLNAAFDEVLKNARGTPQEVNNFSTDLTSLANVDAHSANSPILATNDYTLILQVALGVGQPLARPKTAPSLLATDAIKKGSHITTVSQPTLVGTYATGTTLQIVDDKGQVLGTGVVGKNGQYSIQTSVVLTPGTYVLAVRAFDNGIVSAPSPILRIRVVPSKHPKG